MGLVPGKVVPGSIPGLVPCGELPGLPVGVPTGGTPPIVPLGGMPVVEGVVVAGGTGSGVGGTLADGAAGVAVEGAEGSSVEGTPPRVPGLVPVSEGRPPMVPPGTALGVPTLGGTVVMGAVPVGGVLGVLGAMPPGVEPGVPRVLVPYEGAGIEPTDGVGAKVEGVLEVPGEVVLDGGTPVLPSWATGEPEDRTKSPTGMPAVFSGPLAGEARPRRERAARR